MINDWPIYFSLFLAFWSAIVGGVFSAFSEFVMAGLLRAAPAGGIESMQQINRTVLRTQFVAGIVFIPPLSIGLAVYAWRHPTGAALVALLIAPAIYITGVFLTTIFGNVPMNNRLARMDPQSAEASSYWRSYVRHWTRLNHVRTISSLLTAVLYLFAALSLAASG